MNLVKKFSLFLLFIIFIQFPNGCNCDANNEKAQYNKFGIHDNHYASGWNTIDEAHQMYDCVGELKIKNFHYYILWWSVEKNNKGEYNWDRHDDLINYVSNKGLNIIITLYGGNCLYDPEGTDYSGSNFHFFRYTPEYFEGRNPGFPPYTGEALQGWLNFVNAAVNRYKDKVKTWEIWNEPDLIDEYNGEYLGTYWQPVPNPLHYSNLLKATANKIKEIQQDAVIIMGGLTVFNGYRNFLKSCIDNDVLEYIDVVGIHPYRYKPEGSFDINTDFTVSPLPTTFEEEIESLKEFITSYKSNIKIWDTESGYINFAIPNNQDLAQAKYLTRSMLVEYAAGLDGLTYFKLVAHRTPELFEGILYRDTVEKKIAFNAFKILSEFIGDTSVKYEKTIKKQLQTGEDIRIELYSKNNKPIILYWFPEIINNNERAVSTRQLEIEGISINNFKVKDIINNIDLPIGTYSKTDTGILFDNLPVTDYPFILYSEN